MKVSLTTRPRQGGVQDQLGLYPDRVRILIALIAIVVVDFIIDYGATTYAGTIDWPLHVPLIFLVFFLGWTIFRPRKAQTRKIMAECHTCHRLFIAEYEPGEEKMLETIECPQCFFNHSPQLAVVALMRYLNEEYKKKGSPRLIEIVKGFDSTE